MIEKLAEGLHELHEMGEKVSKAHEKPKDPEHVRRATRILGITLLVAAIVSALIGLWAHNMLASEEAVREAFAADGDAFEDLTIAEYIGWLWPVALAASILSFAWGRWQWHLNTAWLLLIYMAFVWSFMNLPQALAAIENETCEGIWAYTGAGSPPIVDINAYAEPNSQPVTTLSVETAQAPNVVWIGSNGEAAMYLFTESGIETVDLSWEKAGGLAVRWLWISERDETASPFATIHVPSDEKLTLGFGRSIDQGVEYHRITLSDWDDLIRNHHVPGTEEQG